MGKLWCLAIKHDMTPEEDPFKVEYDDNDDVAALKEKVKGKKGISLPADELAVWQCKEPKLLADANVDELEDILHKVDFSDRRKAVRLASAKMVASLKLSKNEVLLVQIPGKCPHSCYNMMQFNAVKEPPATALLAAKKQVWCLAIKHDMTLEGRPFQVEYDDNDSVATLKEKFKAKMEPKLNDFAANSFTVLQCKEPKLLADVNANKLQDTLKEVDSSDHEKVVELTKAMMVINIELSKNEILLVQMPGKCPHSSYNFTILTYQWTLARSSEDGEAATSLQEHEIYEGLEDSIIIMNEDNDNFEQSILSGNKIYEITENVANVNHLTRFQKNLQKK